MIMQTKYFDQLVVNISNKINPQIPIVSLIKIFLVSIFLLQSNCPNDSCRLDFNIGLFDIHFYVCRRSPRTEFADKLIASDLLIST